MSHTPGPWGLFNKIIVQLNEAGDIPLNSRMVAVLDDSLGGADEKQAFVPSVEDVKLILAAPELLTWLQAVVRQLEYEISAGSRDDSSGSGGMVKNLKKVIAKAGC